MGFCRGCEPVDGVHGVWMDISGSLKPWMQAFRWSGTTRRRFVVYFPSVLVLVPKLSKEVANSGGKQDKLF